MFGKELKKASLGGLETGWLEGAQEEEKSMQKSSSLFSRWDPQKERVAVTTEKNSPVTICWSFSFIADFCGAVCSPSCCWEQQLRMFLCSALGITILFCFPIFLVLVEFCFSINIFCVLFSMHRFCLLTAVEIVAETSRPRLDRSRSRV